MKPWTPAEAREPVMERALTERFGAESAPMESSTPSE